MSEDNTLSIIPGIVERLREHVEGAKVIASIGAIAGAVSLDEYLPGIFVADAGSTYQESEGDDAQVELQRVIVSIVVKNVRDTADLATPDHFAGQYKAQVEKALIGFIPGDRYEPLQAEARQAADYQVSFVEYPITFTAPCAVGN